jgi:hypothetical protein
MNTKLNLTATKELLSSHLSEIGVTPREVLFAYYETEAEKLLTIGVVMVDGYSIACPVEAEKVGEEIKVDNRVFSRAFLHIAENFFLRRADNLSLLRRLL